MVQTDRTGVIYGSDYIMTLPEEFADGIRKCQDESGVFQFDRWSELGLPEVNPLWLLFHGCSQIGFRYHMGVEQLPRVTSS